MGHSRKQKKSWKRFVVNIVSPAVLTIVFFNISIFMVIIPSMKSTIIERKKETIKELTLTILSELSALDQQVKSGALTAQKAQKRALEQIETIRYGEESKDYFWVTTMRPTMVMHPYRKDLDGQDVSKYSDPSGKMLFSEFVKTVRAKGEGYVDYLWQWKDDPSRIVPKLSYVKAFEPWGWIIGTGIYLDDVREEVAQITRRTIQLSILISILIAFLLLYIARESLKSERSRMDAETALRDSEEKYRLLVESTTEGVALSVDERLVYGNSTLLQMLGHSLQELTRKTIGEICIHERTGGNGLQASLIPDHLYLKTKGGELVDVIATVSDVIFEGKMAQIHTFKDITQHDKADEGLSRMLSELQTALLMPHAPVGQSMTKLVECELGVSIKKAASIMSTENSSAILIKGPEGEHVGIVSDADLRRRAMTSSADLDRPVSSIMTAPLIKVSRNTLLFEATLIFQEKGIRHLAVTDEDGRIVGLLNTSEVIKTQSHPASILIREIQKAKQHQEIARSRRNLPSLVKALLDNGAKVDSVTRILSSVSDAVINRSVELAIEQLGPPPVRFSFMTFGSEARGEQTLRTDQDNAIIYADPDPDQAADVHQYFLKLGALVCAWLNDAGYSYCKGEVMAKNPKWCQPLSQWLQYFSDCVTAADSQDLFDVNVFFDFRAVYSEADFSIVLRRHLAQLIENKPAFFFYLAEATLQYKPPLSFFGNIQFESPETDSESPYFNIKSAMIPIVNFARIYALKNGLEATGTSLRLRGLLEKGVLVESSYDELVLAFSFLMQMRLSHQAKQVTSGKKPDNNIPLQRLTQLEKSMLKKIFSDILVFQARVRADFARTG